MWVLGGILAILELYDVHRALGWLAGFVWVWGVLGGRAVFRCQAVLPFVGTRLTEARGSGLVPVGFRRSVGTEKTLLNSSR